MATNVDDNHLPIYNETMSNTNNTATDRPTECNNIDMNQNGSPNNSSSTQCANQSTNQSSSPSSPSSSSSSSRTPGRAITTANTRSSIVQSPFTSNMIIGGRGSRFSDHCAIDASTATAAANYLFFDANTFKQVKRLYCGMLMVAMAYAVTMIIMMVVLYKTLPMSSSSSSSLSSSSLSSSPSSTSGSGAFASSSPPIAAGSALHFRSYETAPSSSSSMLDMSSMFDRNPHHRVSSQPLRSSKLSSSSSSADESQETARTYLDQVIAINFLTLILYSLAFYAAQRELYTLTLAFTSTLSFTMMFSVVKIFVEGVHFPNNFMSLLLRISIVFVALVYLGQLRRKHHFLRNLWLSPTSLLGQHPAFRSSGNGTDISGNLSVTQTAQLIRQFLANANHPVPGSSPPSSSSSASYIANNSHHIVGDAGGGAAGEAMFKSDGTIFADYRDLPPAYEEALRCPAAIPRSNSNRISSTSTKSSFDSSSSSSSGSSSIDDIENQNDNLRRHSQAISGIAPPSFDEIEEENSTMRLSAATTTTITDSAETVPNFIAANNENNNNNNNCDDNNDKDSTIVIDITR